MKCPELLITTFKGVAVLALIEFGGCKPKSSSATVPSVEWDQQKYGGHPAKRPLSNVDVTTEKSWVVVRERIPTVAQATRVVRYRIGGMDCGDCQHLVADELGRLSGVHLARVSQSPPETVVEYDSVKLDARQIEGTVVSLGLWPKTLDTEATK